MGDVEKIGRHDPPCLEITVGLIAHDAKKEDLSRFARAHRRLLEGFRLVAPEDTARAIGDLGFDVEAFAPGTLGGDIQLAAAVVEGRIDAVIFLNDPLVVLPSEPDVGTMLRVCDLDLVPLATNLASAEILVHHLARMRRAGEAAASELRAAPDGSKASNRVAVLTLLPGTDGGEARESDGN